MTEKPLTVADNLVVSLAFTLLDDEGDLIDEAGADDPLVYLHGNGQLIPALEAALQGKTVGDEAKVVVTPAEGYGEYDEDDFDLVPFDLFPDDVDVEIGMNLFLEDEDGEVQEAYVAEIQDEGIILDFNHPLAGETLHFTVKVLDVRAATAEELDHGHVHGVNGHNH